MRRFWVLLSLAVLGCAPPHGDEDGAVPDDADLGDSLPDGKADGYGVPASLGLDKKGIVYLTFDDGRRWL